MNTVVSQNFKIYLFVNLLACKDANRFSVKYLILNSLMFLT